MTVYAAHNGAAQMWKSANGGDTFHGVSARENIAAFVVVDSTTLYVAGASNEIWKSANSGLRWSRSKEKPTGVVVSMAISPNFASDDTILCGMDNGRVYLSQDGGLNFRKQGGINPGGSANNVYVAFDSSYNSGYVYAVADDVDEVYRWEPGVSTEWDQITATGTATDPGGILVYEGILYTTDKTVLGEGMLRSVCPKCPLGNAVNFSYDSVTQGLNTTFASLGDIEAAGGSDTLVLVIDEGNINIQGFSDSLIAATKTTAPKTGAVVSGNKVTLSWESLADATDYQRELRLDSSYKVQVAGYADNVTSATSDVITGLQAGFTYYWRVRAEEPVLSPWAKGSFTIRLTDPVLVSPDPREVFVIPVRPQFSWESVGGATGYELQLADNPFYADAWVKKPLTHTVWVWDEDLEYSTTYYWRVKAVTRGTESNWSEGAFTTIGEKEVPPPAPPQQIVVQPAPVTTMPATPPAPPQPITFPQPIAPVYLWVIIIIGAVLIICLIVLIVRTRRP
jgi:hypothetical protein